jgi:hypothetical protein
VLAGRGEICQYIKQSAVDSALEGWRSQKRLRDRILPRPALIMNWVRLALAALIVCFFIALAPGWVQDSVAQERQPIVVRPIQLPPWPKSIEPFSSTPPDIMLTPRGEGARHGQLWIRTEGTVQLGYGLWVAGKVDGPPPDFPLTRDVLPSKDHIEIWLATARDVDMPEIGWRSEGNPEEEFLPQGAASCGQDEPGGPSDDVKSCRAWAESQVRYRRYFKRLFVRQWLVGPKEHIETFATPASEYISDWYGNNEYVGPPARFMRPEGEGLLRISFFPESSGYSFSVFIPLESFPPLRGLETSELWLLVDVFNAARPGKEMGAYSTSSPARACGDPKTFNALRLDPHFSFPLTPCGFPLHEANASGKHLTWLLPNLRYSPDVLSDTVTVENSMTAWNTWPPTVMSPELDKLHHFWREVSRSEGIWICGPELAIAKAGKSRISLYDISEEGLEYKQMPNGHLLIKAGPEIGSVGSSHGAGGADPVTQLRFFDVDKDMEFREALSLTDIIDGINLISQDFTISPDWSHVTEYNLNGPYESRTWSSVTWCLKANSAGGYNYEPCGEKTNVQPPNPPVLKELRQGIN